MHDSLPAGAGAGGSAGDAMNSVLSDRMFVDSVLASVRNGGWGMGDGGWLPLGRDGHVGGGVFGVR